MFTIRMPKSEKEIELEFTADCIIVLFRQVLSKKD